MLFSLFACLHLVGGPYALVQAVAWGNMIASYSKESGIIQGAKDTFSGEKPCHMCCKIAEAKKADGEKKPDAPAPASPTKVVQEFLVSTGDSLAPPSFTTAPPITFSGHLFQDGTSAHSPPVPPPQRGA